MRNEGQSGMSLMRWSPFLHPSQPWAWLCCLLLASPVRPRCRRAPQEIAAYQRPACRGGSGRRGEIKRLAAPGSQPQCARRAWAHAADGGGVPKRRRAAVHALIEAGADLNPLENQSLRCHHHRRGARRRRDGEAGDRLGRQHARHHQPLQGHRADRRRPPGPRRGRRRS